MAYIQSPSGWIGRRVSEVPRPAAVLDVNKIRRHCHNMISSAENLGVGLRVHVKTHKTAEVTKLQLGDSLNDAKLIVSTVAEFEFLLPLLQSYLKAGRKVNVLYGIPIAPSQIPRLAALAKSLGPGSFTFMVDHPSHIASVLRFRELTGFPGGVFLKIDTGYHRAGLPPAAVNKQGLTEQLSALDRSGELDLVGLYSHSSLSYTGTTPQDALDALTGEISGCLDALRALRKHHVSDKRLIISVGATPQVAAIQNLFDERIGSSDDSAANLREHMRRASGGEVDGLKTSLELHAGVYSILDLQQMATRARVGLGSYEDEIALSVATEVVSVYNDGERKQPEALVAVGALGLGREPCPGGAWGVVSSQGVPGLVNTERRLVVARISQEHAILAWETKEGEDPASLPPLPLQVGQCVFVFPNHACITGAMYKSYYVLDSADNAEEIMDVWQRASGW